MPEEQAKCGVVLAPCKAMPSGWFLLQLAGECEVTYAGRAQSTAEAGDYLLVIKPDGCLMIHGAKGVKPRNWQPTNDHLSATLEAGLVIVTGERHNPPEGDCKDVLGYVTIEPADATGFVPYAA